MDCHHCGHPHAYHHGGDHCLGNHHRHFGVDHHFDVDHHNHGGDLFHGRHHHTFANYYNTYQPQFVIHTGGIDHHGSDRPQCYRPVYYRTTAYEGRPGGNGRQKVSAVIGTVLLVVSVPLLICGILSFAGVIRGGYLPVGIALLASGGMFLLAGLVMTTTSCLAWQRSKSHVEQVTYRVPPAPDDQEAPIPQFQRSSPLPPPYTAPPPYSSVSAQPYQATNTFSPSYEFTSGSDPAIGYANHAFPVSYG